MMDKKVKINKIDAIGRRLSLKGEGGQEIGHAYLYILNNDLHQQPFAFIEDIEIKEAYQGSGHGKLLLEEIEKFHAHFLHEIAIPALDFSERNLTAAGEVFVEHLFKNAGNSEVFKGNHVF